MTATKIPINIRPAMILSNRETLYCLTTNVGYGMVPSRAISSRIRTITTRKTTKYQFFRKFHLGNAFIEHYKRFHKKTFEKMKKEVFEQCR